MNSLNFKNHLAHSRLRQWARNTLLLLISSLSQDDSQFSSMTNQLSFSSVWVSSVSLEASSSQKTVAVVLV